MNCASLEQAEDPRSPLKRLPFGMRGLSAPTIEAFYRRELLDDITAPQRVNDSGTRSTPPAAHWMQQARSPGGHFAGIQFYLDNIDSSKWPYRLPSPAVTNMAAEMEQIESVLADRANAMGVELRRGLGVENLESSDEDVTIRAGAETFRGLSGLGDLVLTCGAGQSRNHALGLALGHGHSLKAALAGRRSVVEGVATAAAAAELAARLGIEMPISEAVDAVLHRGVAIDEMTDRLLRRPYRSE